MKVMVFLLRRGVGAHAAPAQDARADLMVLPLGAAVVIVIVV